MKVNVLESTDNPERLVCKAARGDYYDGYIDDVTYQELMETVDTNRSDRVAVLEEYGGAEIYEDESIPIDKMTEDMKTRARTRSFIRKQLSRGHYGPWEHPQITFAIEGVSRVTMAQITRHRHMTFDVQSQRYVNFDNSEAVVPKSLKEEVLAREVGVTDVENQERLRELYKSNAENAIDLYKDMVDNGVPKEDARFILPIGTPVNITFSGNSRSFMHLLDMRKKANAQWEIRDLSEEIIDKLKDWMPYTYSYYDENAPHKLSP